MATPDICNLGTAFEFAHYTIEGRQPFLHKVVVVAGPEEAGHSAEHAAGLIAPGNATARLESRLDLVLIVQHRRHEVEAAHHIDGAVFVREHHRLLRWERERSRL